MELAKKQDEMPNDYRNRLVSLLQKPDSDKMTIVGVLIAYNLAMIGNELWQARKARDSHAG